MESLTISGVFFGGGTNTSDDFVPPCRCLIGELLHLVEHLVELGLCLCLDLLGLFVSLGLLGGLLLGLGIDDDQVSGFARMLRRRYTYAV